MKRSFKIFGLALIAAVGMSTVVAAVAHGTQASFTAAEYPVAVTGEQEGENYFEFTPGRKMSCQSITGEATLTKAATSIKLEPNFEGCQSGGISLTVTVNGCHSEVTAGTATSTEVADGSAHIKCPPGKRIEVSMGGICTIHIPEQTITSGGTATNKIAGEGTSKSWLTIDANVTGIKYIETDTPSSFFCPFTSHTIEGTNGKAVGSAVIKGFEDLGTHEDPNEPGTTTNTEGSPIGIHVK